MNPVLARVSSGPNLFGFLSAFSLIGCTLPAEPQKDEQDVSTDSGGSPGLPGAGGSGGLPQVVSGGTGGQGSLCPYYDPDCDDTDPEMPAPDDDFVLVFQDDFDTFDTNRWNRHDHTFAENASYFSYDNVQVQDGKLVLRLTQKQNYDPNNPDDRPYLGAEVSTKDLYTYMRITARIKFAQGQGIVSSLFTYSDNAGVYWNEIDVEYLGYKDDEVQYNLITSNCSTCGSDRSAVPYPDMLGVRPYEDFHEYEITWTPAGVSFKVDGLPRWTEPAPTMTAPMRVRMNVWPTSGVDPFAGTLDPAAIPTFAEYDWVRVEQYMPN